MRYFNLTLASVPLWFCPLSMAAADSCTESQSALNSFIHSQLTSCTQDSDCTTVYIGADSCMPPYAVARDWETQPNTDKLVALQRSVRNACGKAWDNRPPCSPIPFHGNVICKDKHCGSDQLSPPPNPSIQQ